MNTLHTLWQAQLTSIRNARRYDKRMRMAFVKHLGVTALQYRQHFGAYVGPALAES